jgi:Ca2+-binding RTX toxin-like protein
LSPGNDVLNGGSDIDAVDYSNVDEDIVVSLETNKASGIGIGQDSILGFEVVLSGSGNDQLSGGVSSDILSGGGGSDQIAGGAGNDVLIGGAGNDILIGGNGIDKADYSTVSTVLTVDLSKGTSTGGNDVGNDSLTSIENVTGGSAADTLIGNVGTNVLSGGAGNDELIGGAGNDTLDGGVGFDCAEYMSATSNLTITLGDGKANGTALGGADVGTDSLISIEEACGGSGNDTIKGRSDTASQLEGGAGNDVLTGYGFNDILIGGNGIDRIAGGTGADTFRYAFLNDALVGGTSAARTFDRITDFSIGSDILDGPGKTRVVTKLWGVTALTDTALGSLLNTANFAAGVAATFTFGSGASVRAFVGINDEIAGFNANKDAIIEITGYTGSIASLAIV